jgi:Ni/Fe-hydrogenase 1 B-type cytochrome subunit
MARRVLNREKVYDPILRTIHAWNGVAILLLLIGSQVAEWAEFTPDAVTLWRFHVWAGYALLLGLVARLAWGLNGPRHARLAEFWQPRAWLGAIRSRRFLVEPELPGHHPLAGAVFILVYLVLLVMAVTGLSLAAIDQGQGPLSNWLAHDVALRAAFKEPHDLLRWFLWGFVVVHVAALILHESRHGIPIAQSMVSGYQYREEKDG